MECFRRAEAQVQANFPQFCAEAIIAATLPVDKARAERILTACIDATSQGLSGVNIIPDPYCEEADWLQIYRWAERAASAGLGIAIHAGEFSAANLGSALQIPGLKRIGHAVYAASDEHIFEQLVESGVTVECPLTCNVILGATESFATHPIQRFVDHGIPVTLCTDDPVRIDITIGKEYAVAVQQGFSTQELLQFTQNGIAASFTTDERRAGLLSTLHY
ncbi:hypothetical protein KFU94_60650 [Chloroflexi bacterium TSY]|nr:hypothetical protein [Chloroflexi bacterium TSY]